MLKFSANLSLLFTEVALPERFKLAREAGFSGVEIQFPYQLPAEQIQEALLEHQLELVLFNIPADDLLQGGEGLAAVPEKQAQFQEAVAQAADYAAILQPRCINVLPGCCFDNSRYADYLETLLSNLDYAASCMAELGVMTVFEAINSFDMPHFIIDTSAKMLETLQRVNHPNLRLQYDIYHLSRMGEDCAGFLAEQLDKIGHIQFADCPGRGEPGTGHLDFAGLFEQLQQSSYSGWVGAEYRPQQSSLASFSWFNSELAK